MSEVIDVIKKAVEDLENSYGIELHLIRYRCTPKGRYHEGVFGNDQGYEFMITYREGNQIPLINGSTPKGYVYTSKYP